MEMMIVEAGVARAGQSQDALTYGGRRARRGGRPRLAYARAAALPCR
jgi:hypothetical protein